MHNTLWHEVQRFESYANCVVCVVLESSTWPGGKQGIQGIKVPTA